jgi:hypothetical protein
VFQPDRPLTVEIGEHLWKSREITGPAGIYRLTGSEGSTYHYSWILPYRTNETNLTIKVKGATVNTIAEAARKFGVSTKTVNKWIHAQIISEPPTVAYGAGTMRIFPTDYLSRAKKELSAYRKSKLKRNGN